MSRWAEMFTALSRGVDTADTNDTTQPERGRRGVVSLVSAVSTAPPPKMRRRGSPRGCLPDTTFATAHRSGARPSKSAPQLPNTTATSRASAEGFARLDPDRPPGRTPPRRWRRFVDDIAHFLDSPFCGKMTPRLPLCPPCPCDRPGAQFAARRYRSYAAIARGPNAADARREARCAPSARGAARLDHCVSSQASTA